ncbi:MAG: hypothetical protein AB7F20_15750 [Geoalkalibacter sp.]|uniref:hypothetical protein n=1 Tax=Geoalkalibacter sp. TaxID=3041440 RepID=UPI003D12F17D
MNRVFVNPEILQWAGQRAGLDVGDLLPKFPKLQDWFEGGLAPTLKQLEAFAHATHTPIGFFFLPKPPEISGSITHFGQHPGSKFSTAIKKSWTFSPGFPRVRWGNRRRRDDDT